MDLITLRTKLEKAWSKETSYWPEWYDTASDGAFGQCAVTALVVETVLGGKIMSGIVKITKGLQVRHYWNKIHGLDIDLTWRQFPAGAKLTDIKEVSAKQLRKSKSVTERYFKLYNKKNGF